MKRDVNQVRRSLQERKKTRLKELKQSTGGRSTKQISSAYTNPNQAQTEQKTPIFIKQVIASGLIFLLTIIILHFPLASNRSKGWLTSHLNEDFPFATVNVWYEEQFGQPFGFFVDQSTIPVTNQQVLPVNGTINESIDLNGQGVMIEVDRKPDVYAIDRGTVLFAGKTQETNQTVVIQHPDRTKSTYGFLDEIDVRPYQFVEASQKVGAASDQLEAGANVYFSLQKGNQFIDPFEVITVNDLE